MIENVRDKTEHKEFPWLFRLSITDPFECGLYSPYDGHYCGGFYYISGYTHNEDEKSFARWQDGVMAVSCAINAAVVFFIIKHYCGDVDWLPYNVGYLVWWIKVAILQLRALCLDDECNCNSRDDYYRTLLGSFGIDYTNSETIFFNMMREMYILMGFVSALVTGSLTQFFYQPDFEYVCNKSLDSVQDGNAEFCKNISGYLVCCEIQYIPFHKNFFYFMALVFGNLLGGYFIVYMGANLLKRYQIEANGMEERDSQSSSTRSSVISNNDNKIHSRGSIQSTSSRGASEGKGRISMDVDVEEGALNPIVERE